MQADGGLAGPWSLPHPAGRTLLDTSVVIDWHDPLVVAALPDEVAISAVTAAELAAGPHLARSPTEAAARQLRLQEVEAMFEPLALDTAAVRSCGPRGCSG